MLLVYPNIHFIELSRSDIYFERNISGIFNAKNGYRPQKIRVFGRAEGGGLWVMTIPFFADGGACMYAEMKK